MKLTDIVGQMLEYLITLFKDYILKKRQKKLEKDLIQEKAKSEAAAQDFIDSANSFDKQYSMYRTGVRRTLGDLFPNRTKGKKSSGGAGEGDSDSGPAN